MSQKWGDMVSEVNGGEGLFASNWYEGWVNELNITTWIHLKSSRRGGTRGGVGG